MMDVDAFYIKNNLRVHEIPVGKKCPIEVGWPDSRKPYSSVAEKLEDSRFNKYGWILDDCHIVIDIDVHSDEANGFDSLKKLEDDFGYILTDVCNAVVETPSGGRHYYFSKPVGFRPGRAFAKTYPGIDFIAGKGKQVIAAGSFHDSHPGVYTFSKSDGLAPLPARLIEILDSMSGSPSFTKTAVDYGDRSGDEFNTSERGLGVLVSELARLGYTIRARSGHYEFDRPGKTTGSKCSGHVGLKSKQGNYQLTCFSLSDPFFPSGESMTIFNAYALLCHGGDLSKAAASLYELGFADERDRFAAVDISAILASSSVLEDDDEEFALGCIPDSGLIRDVFGFYEQMAHRFSPMMGLAVALSFCEVLFGRKVKSHTDLRTNDYNVVIAPTNSGKEACEKTISKIFESVDPDLTYLIPPDVQSGNGLIAAVAQRRCCIWVSDEFGKTLNSILDKKQKNHHQQVIATHLLKLYSKAESNYLGAAHAAGTKNAIIQPHLCLLGLTTGSTLFESVDVQNVSDGLFGRIAFWPIQKRPKRRRMRSPDVPGFLTQKTSDWMTWEPGGNLGGEHPQPALMEMTGDALGRWLDHGDKIDDRMDSESELKNSIWGRVAARSMKLAMVHRAARIGRPQDADWSSVKIEIEDVNWGIKISNWLARICCQLVIENFSSNQQLLKIKKMIMAAIQDGGEISKRDVERANRSVSASDIMAAAIELEEGGILRIEKINTGGRPREVFRRVG